MIIRKLAVALTAATLVTGAGSVAADGDQPWHVSYQIGGVNLDSDRYADDSGLYHNIGFGRFFGNNFSLDVEADQFKADLDTVAVPLAPGVTYDDYKLSGYGLMMRYYVGQRKVRPFFALGIGRQKHRSILYEGWATQLSGGVGLAAQFSKHFSGRAQVLYRRDTDSNSQANRDKYNDLIYTIGLSFDFGGKDAPPPPPPPPPPEKPKPKPAPVNPDLDGDGVPNERDKCPNTRPGAVVDLDGCEVEAVIELEGVHFDFDKATLRPDAIVILNEAAALLKQHQRVVVEVAGHTDSMGSEAYNQGLSERRAKAVKDYLTSKGIKATRLSAKGYGELQPVATNDTEAGRAQNRRVELIILDR